MARAIWSGVISFGMVNIPAKLYPAANGGDERTKLVRLCKTCNSPVGNAYKCKAEGTEVPYNEWDRGYEVAKGEYVRLTKEQVESVKLTSEGQIEIITFVEPATIHPTWEKDRYFVGIDEKKEKISRNARRTFALFHAILKKKGLIAIGKLTLRTNENLVAISAQDKTLLLTRLYYADVVREFEEPALEEAATLTERELTLANTLVEGLKHPFQHEEHKDRYEVALQSLIESVIAGQPITATTLPKAQVGNDLTAALEASVKVITR